MSTSESIHGEEYHVRCSHCGGRAEMIEMPDDKEGLMDGDFICRGMVDCQFRGPGEEFSFHPVGQQVEDMFTPVYDAPAARMKLMFSVLAERKRQDEKWGGPESDDKRKTEIDWIEDIEAYTAWAKQMYRMGSPEKYRRRMMQVAALAVAACESFDRQHN